VAAAPNDLFFVDGEPFRGAAMFLWPVTSKHFVGCSKYGDVTVMTNLGMSNNPVTAHPDLKEVRLGPCLLDCKVMVRFSQPGTITPPGRVCVGTAGAGGGSAPGDEASIVAGLNATGCYEEDFETACGDVTLAAYPNAGYIFRGWTHVPGNPNQSMAYITKFRATSTVTIGAFFYPARPLQVTIDTYPPQLLILADRAPFTAPRSVAWGFETVHTLGAIPVQRDGQGRLMVFDSWSDGGDINHEFKMPAGMSDFKVVAKFVPGATHTFLTDPPLLKLSVDGRENWPNYTFVWPAGSQHTFAAPLEQVDAKGRKYRFRSWSNGQPVNQNLTVQAAPDDVRLTAFYEPVSEIRISSFPSGLALLVDASDCRTPCTLNRPIGAPVRIEAPDQIAVTTGSRLKFQGWVDGGERQRNATALAEVQSFTVAYQLQHQVSASADPAGSVTWRLEPASADGYYDDATRVAVAADPVPGYRFASWTAGLAGVRPSGILTVSGPTSVRARLEPVPYIRPRGVQNGAAELQQEGVAAGSIISVFGRNLAPWSEANTGGMLSQSLAGVTLRLEDRLLPLFMVSDGEVKAQLPSGLPDGQYTLALKWGDKPETTAGFKVVRNAPGLFSADKDGKSVGSFIHANGDAVTADQPPQPGEVITVLATGAGPYDRMVPEGFALPAGSAVRLVDPIELVSGETVWAPVEALASEASIGVNAIRFQLPEGILPVDGYIPFKVRVNGVESNTVLLPAPL
jgi:uncharacterized protein (TIGR03437 family)